MYADLSETLHCRPRTEFVNPELVEMIFSWFSIEKIHDIVVISEDRESFSSITKCCSILLGSTMRKASFSITLECSCDPH